MMEIARLWQLRAQSPAILFLILPVLLGCAHSSGGPRAPSSTGSSPESIHDSIHESIRTELSSSSAADGSIVLATVHLPKGSDPSRLSASLEETKDISFFPIGTADEEAYQAVIAVPFNHKPGKIKIEIHYADSKPIQVPFEVVDGHYRAEVLKVPERTVNPPKKELARIIREKNEIGAIYRNESREKLWKGAFSMPIDSAVTSPFGSKRVYNGEMKSFHQGLDLKAPMGTPIRAPSAGVVVLAKNLFFTGNTVLLDHGYGVFTVYGHMSALKVKKGDRVEASAILGLSGMTGRASGPHLHWGAVVHKLKVNPMDLTRVLK